MNSSTSNSKQRVIGLLLLWLGSVVTSGLVILFCADVFLRMQVKPNDYFQKQLLLFNTLKQTKVGTIDVIAFGDSHTSQGFWGQDNAINMGIAGESFDQTSIKLRTVVEALKPKKVLLQLSPQMFASYRFNEGTRYYPYYYGNKPWYINPYKILMLSDPHYRERFLKYWQAFNKEKSGRDIARFTSWGTVAVDQSMTENISEKTIEATEKRVKAHAKQTQKNMLYTEKKIRQTITYLKNQGIDVCTITYPVSPIYRQISKAYPKIQASLEQIEKISLDSNTRYFSYWDLYDNYELFRDKDHLNMKGSQLLTTKALSDCFSY